MIRILQISDTHLAPSRPEYIENWHACVRAIADLAPDLVINSGDITLNGAEDEDELALARRLHDALPVPWRSLAGNHDIGDSPATGYTEPPKPLVNAERIASYERHFGPDRWTVDQGGWRLIGLNAQLWGSGLPAEAAQEEYLAAASAGAGGQPIAVFIHQPLYLDDPEEQSEPHRYLQNPSRRRLLAAMDGGDVRVISSGHLHQWRDAERGGRRHLWAPSSAFVIAAAAPSEIGQKVHGMIELSLHEDGGVDARLIEPAGIARHDIVDQVRDGALFPPSYSSVRAIANPS